MSAILIPRALAASRRADWGIALAVIGVGLAILGLLFRTEVAAAVRTWENSTAYNHCWLVLPIAAWLAWVRRDRLASLRPEPSAWLALLALPAALAWIVAERLGIMEGRQFAVLGLVWALMLGVLGYRFGRAMAVPLGYLVFLVPFGEFAVPALQSVTAWMIEFGLGLLGIPHYVDSLIIETPSGTFLVAEACAGLRFLVAAIAFGALYAVTMFRSPGRRIAVMALALIVPILANGLRALGIVVLAQYLGSAEAAAADHVIYGWGFFSVVILLLVMAGLPFREDGDPPAAVPGTASPARAAPLGLAATMVLVVALASAGPALATALDRAGAGGPTSLAAPLAAVEGCETAAGGTLRCADVTVTATLLVFPPRTTWAAVAAERRRLLPGGDDAVTFRIPVTGANWDVRQPREGSGAAAAAAWRDGRPAGDGLRSRAAQAWNALRGGAPPPVVAGFALRPDRVADAAAQTRHMLLLRAVVETQGAALAARAATISSGSAACGQVSPADPAQAGKPASGCNG
ncbi:MAG TPA: exosortase A [Roseomonas sp.]